MIIDRLLDLLSNDPLSEQFKVTFSIKKKYSSKSQLFQFYQQLLITIKVVFVLKLCAVRANQLRELLFNDESTIYKCKNVRGFTFFADDGSLFVFFFFLLYA